MIAKIAPAALHNRIAAPDELAVLDIREAGEFGLGHLLTAANLPLSTLEAGIPALVPRRATPVVLVDADGTGRAAFAAERLAGLGYGDVLVLDGGIAAWREGGFSLFEGQNVPTKAFAEAVLEHFATPEITAPALKALMEEGRAFTLLDGRTAREHTVRCIPGSASLPNGELLLHLADVVPDEEAPIIVHCAGRTRSIIGAQTLIAAGVRNPVFALRGGTQEWSLNGLELERGSDRAAPPLTAAAQARAAGFAAHLGTHGGLAIDRATFGTWCAEAERAEAGRTLYLFDVRTRAEYEAGHLPGAVHAPAGQLVHAVDLWAATRGARIALIDSPPYARAAMAAFWLRRQGWEAGVPDVLDIADFTEAGVPEPAPLPFRAPRVAAQAVAEGVILLDVGTSTDFHAAHLPGARWTTRARLPDLLRSGDLPGEGAVVLYGDDASDVRPDLIADDLRSLAPALSVRVLEGGRAGWRADGRPVEAGPGPSEAEDIDVLFWLHDRHTGNLQSARTYLDWELGLTRRVAADGTLRFAL